MKKQENGNLRLVTPADKPTAGDSPSASEGVSSHSPLEKEAASRDLETGAAGRASDSPEETDAKNQGDFNLRVLLQAPARFVREKFGEQTLESIAAAAGLSPSDLDGKSNWGSLVQVEAFLAGLRELVDSDEDFKQACIYKLRECYGPMWYVLRAASPQMLIEQAAKNVKTASSISRYEVMEAGGNRLVLRYSSTKKESRLLCLSRQAQGTALPTLWGLPPATHEETSCIANGDDYCEYHLRWYQHSRWVPLLTGLLAGVAAAAGLWFAGITTLPVWALLPFVGGLAGYAFELRRTNKANLRIGDEINDALRELARDDAESRREIVEFHKREREWAQKMEEQVAERTAALEDVLDQVKRMHEEKRSVLRGFSHDLTNPFQAVYAQASVFRRIRDQLDPELRELVDDQIEAVERMKLMLRELVETASTDAGLIRVKPERMDVPPLVDVLRRRARAFAHDRDIRVSVFATREAPATIVTDRLVFDRVVDNLLTNATRYTTRGSIVVELDGKPGFLTIKVSDTGRGIDACDIDRIFRPKGSDPQRREEGSHGVGLSVVVQLLGQIGGKLEVKSMPGKGTTFWAHFPEAMEEPDKGTGRVTSKPRLSADELIGQVVNVRKSQSP